MKINWENIFCLLLLIFTIYLFFKIQPALNNFFNDNSGVRYYDHGPTSVVDILKLGVVCFTAIAIAQVISRR